MENWPWDHLTPVLGFVVAVAVAAAVEVAAELGVEEVGELSLY